MEGEDRKDLWREIVAVCGGSKDSVCKFRFSNMIPCVCGGSKDPFRFCNMIPCVAIMIAMIMLVWYSTS